MLSVNLSFNKGVWVTKMKTIKISLKQTLNLVLLSILIVSFYPVMAQTDKKMMDKIQRAREIIRQKEKGGDHSKHKKPTDKSEQFRGVYYGYLPCDDCDGIKMTLSLKNKKNYLLVTQYAQSSNREYFEKGKYIWDDKSHTVTLMPRKKTEIRKFRIKVGDQGKTLIQLIPEGQPMKGDEDDYSLVRSDIKNNREIHIH